MLRIQVCVAVYCSSCANSKAADVTDHLPASVMLPFAQPNLLAPQAQDQSIPILGSHPECCQEGHKRLPHTLTSAL